MFFFLVASYYCKCGSFLTSYCWYVERPIAFLNMYFETNCLTDSLNSSTSFAVCFPGVHRYKIILAGNNDNFSSSLQVCIPLLSFSWLTALSWIFSAILNNCDDLRCTYLISDFNGNTSIIYPLSFILALHLQYELFYTIQAVSIQLYITIF